jgi:hypothetical protein
MEKNTIISTYDIYKTNFITQIIFFFINIIKYKKMADAS